MPIDKDTLNKLKKFAKVFTDARDREANESDTVMYLIEFFKEVLGYDPLLGDISKEIPVNDRFCDFGIRLDNKMVFLVEAKAAGIKQLKPKHIEQAENYASRAFIYWVLLTNGVTWQLYHLAFGQGIEHELVFELNLPDELEKNPDFVWGILSVLTKRSIKEESLETYYEQQKLLNPKNIVNLLLGEEMLKKLRQLLARKAPARLDLTTVFHAVVQVLNTEAVASAGDITPPTKKKKHHKHRQVDLQEAGSVPSPEPAQQAAPLPECAESK